MTSPHRFLVLALLLTFCLALCPRISLAQATTGTPPFGTFGGGPDTINLANLNSHLDIPVVNKAGRGMNFTYDLTYDSSVWYPLTSGSTKNWQQVFNWGWIAQTETQTGSLNYSATYINCDTPPPPIQQYVLYSGFVYYDPWGGSHPLGGRMEYDPYNCLNGTTPTMSSLAADGSGYVLSAQLSSHGVLTASVITKNGQVMNPPLNLGTGYSGVTSTATDRNGNQISVTSTGATSAAFTDTLGTTALSVAGSATAASPLTLSYTAPSGAAATYTISYVARTVKTNFACSGIAEYGPTSNNLVDRVTLPDGSFYQFNYEPTPGFAGDYTGRLASVTLPTGGTITYNYTGGNAGINCSDGSAATLTRTTPDGTWTYAQVKGTGTASTTTITDPQGNVTTDNFSGIYLTNSVINKGSSTPLETIFICYNGNFSSCPTASVSAPITRRAIYRQFPGLTYPGDSDILYDAYGNVTDDKEFDYVANANDYPYVTDTTTTYASLGNIVNFPQQVTVKNTAGTIVSQTNYNYDETAVSPSSGTPQHVAVSGSRGNLTSIHYPAGGLVSHLSYYDTGTINSATGVNGAVTTNSYAGASCGNSFPTSVSEPLGLSRSMTWNCTGGVQLTATDENQKPTTTTYNDPYFWRPASITDPLTNVTSFGYQVNPPGMWQSLTFNVNGGQSIANTGTGLDGLGRVIQTSHIQAPGASMWDQAIQSYDSNGRPWKTSVPCVTTGPWTCPVTGQTITYDALNRPLVTTDGGGGTTTYSYNQNDVLVTIGPAPSGENAKSRQLEYDALGRLTSVCEVTGASGNGPCGQNVAYNGFLTKYTYQHDSQTHPQMIVTQNAQAPAAQQQTRTYTYDAMNRLLSENNPESGTTTYTYDVIPTGCWAAGTPQPGDLTRKQDAAGNSLCVTYDSLHRVTGIGPSSVPPCRRFSYDKMSNGVVPVPSGVTLNNTMGRLVEAETDNCGNWPPIPITDEWFSYTPRGETSDVYASTPHSGGYYHSSAGYYANGVLNQLNGYLGSTQTYSAWWNVDGEGRTVSGSPLNGTTYNAASQATSLTFSTGDSDSFTYDPNTGRMTQYKFTVGSSQQSLVDNLTWNANGTLQTQNITDPFNSANTQNCSYSYEDLSRLANANCGSAAAQAFTYDPFGNINKSGSPYSFQPGYSSATNRMTSIGSFTPTYDGVGNVTNDSLHTYTWDNYGRPITIDSVNLTFDALGRMVEQNRSGAYTQFVYSPTGFEMEIMNGPSVVKNFMPLAGGAVAVFNTPNLAYILHPDWLGSFRFASTPSRTMYFDTAYAPFGEPYAESGTPDLSFTGQRQDTVAGLYDFPAREYSIQGRWPSPDPAGLAAVDPSNPQSWNRYAYVMNNPLALIDPTGMNDCPDDKSTCGDDPGTDTGAAGVDLFGASPSGGDLSGLINLMDNPAAIISVTVVAFFTDSISLSDMLNGSWGPSNGGGRGSGSWLATFTKTFVSNFFTPSFYKQELKQGGCLNTFVRATGNALIPSPLPSVSTTAGAGTMAVSTALRYNAAQAYAASRTNVLGGQGLIFPQNSIPYNKILTGSAVTTLAEGGLGYVDGALFQGLLGEAEAAYNGNCH